MRKNIVVRGAEDEETRVGGAGGRRRRVLGLFMGRAGYACRPGASASGRASPSNGRSVVGLFETTSKRGVAVEIGVCPRGDEVGPHRRHGTLTKEGFVATWFPVRLDFGAQVTEGSKSFVYCACIGAQAVLLA